MLRTSKTPRLGWPLVLLLAGLGCIGLATIEAQRSIRSNRAISDAASSGYARFAAWSYHQHLTEALRLAAWEVLGAVNHGSSEHTSSRIPDARELGHYLPYDVTCACHRTIMAPMPVSFLGFTLGTDTLMAGGNQAPASTDGWLADPLVEAGRHGSGHVLDPSRRNDPEIEPAEQRWLIDTLTAMARGSRSPWGYEYIVARSPAKLRVYVTTLMPTSWGDTLVYAAEFHRTALDSLLGAVLDNEGLLPDAFGRRANREILSVQVSGASGEPLFASTPPDQWQLDATSPLPKVYGAMTIRVQIRPELVKRLVIGGLPRSRLPLLLALLTLAAGLTVVAVTQLRREAGFARARSAFVANVSHELRTPIAQIRLAVDTLRLGREPDPERRSASLAVVDREVTRLQHLVEGVLRFSRGAGADAGAALTSVDVTAEARSVVDEFRPLVGSRRVAIEVSGTGHPVVPQRSGAIRQVLLNLLDNAAKYGPEGQTVRVEVEARAGGGARITVRDEGPGVPAKDRERIWEPFERGSVAAERAVGGSGIGLTIVREIVTLHGGTVEVVPDRDGGVFRIEWPGAFG